MSGPLPQLQPQAIPKGNAPLPFAEPPAPSPGYTTTPLNLAPNPAPGYSQTPLNLAPNPGPGYTTRPLELAPPPAAAASGASGLGAAAIAGLGLGALGLGFLAGEGYRQAGLALEEAGLIPDSDIFQRYPWEVTGGAPLRDAIAPGAAPPFTGGQSPGVAYKVFIVFASGAPDLWRYTLSGPLNYRVGGVGSVNGYAVQGDPSNLNNWWSLGGHHFGGDIYAPNGMRVERLDGQPDTGGNPAPVPENYRPPVPGGARQPAPAPALDPAPWQQPKPAPAPSPSPAPSPRVPIVPPAPARDPDKDDKNPPAPLPGIPPSQQPKAPGSPGGGGISGSPKTAPLPTATSPLSAPRPAVPPAPQPQPQPSPQPQPQPVGVDICQSPCIQNIGQGVNNANTLLQRIAQTVGVDEFPGTLPLLNGRGVVPVANIPQMVRWQVQAFDSVCGQFPLSVQVFQADGKVKTIRLENLAHSIDELFGMLLAVAEDADAAVNISARNIVETIQAKIAAKQAGELATANQKFLGYNIKAVPREVKISVTPAAAGADNKLQNQEMAAFLEPSKQQYIGSEYDDSKQLLPIVERTLEDGEIARAALFRPVKVSKEKGDVGLTGEFIRSSRNNDEILNKAWAAFLEQLKREGYEVDGNKSQPK